MKNARALSFVTIMVIIVISSLLLRFGIERIIKINIAQNESNAQATLKLIAVALENYAKDHLGAYPPDISTLTASNPAYLDDNYLTKSPIRGYDYNCSRVEASGYNCSANPIICNLTGKKNYTVNTGALLTSEDCSKKD